MTDHLGTHVISNAFSLAACLMFRAISKILLLGFGVVRKLSQIE